MTLRIEIVIDGLKTGIRLSGQVKSEHLDEFTTQIKNASLPIALDLDGVTLVDVEVVRYLNACAATTSDCCTARPTSANGCSVSTIEKNKAIAIFANKNSSMSN